MKWSVPKIWANGTCWIIGGGPSIITQFNIPDDIVEKVRIGELPIAAYSPFMHKLHNKHIIGINGAYGLGNWVDVCFFGDKLWYFNNKPALMKFHGLVVGCPLFLGMERWLDEPVKYLQRHVHRFGISVNPKKVCWNLNSGAAAISFAVNAGCKRIVLLGFDMHTDGGKGHWHNLYNNKMNMPFDKHLMGFEQIAQDAKRLGIEILNASPDSAIVQFKKVMVNDLI